MSSARKQIRAAIKAALMNKTSAADRVFSNRTDPLLDKATDIEGGTAEFPLLLVIVTDEDSELLDESPRRYRRTAKVKVEGTTNVGDNSDDALDDFADEIEAAMLADDSLGGLANDIRMTGTRMVLADSGRKVIGGVTLSFDVEFITDAPSCPVDEFATLDTQYSLDGKQADPADRAETLIEGLNQ